MRYDLIAADIRKVTDDWETAKLDEVRQIDAVMFDAPAKRRKALTRYSTEQAQRLFDRWSLLDKYLLLKYMDGNVKSEHGDALDYLARNGAASHFVDNGNGRDIPDKIQWPGYNEKWKRAVAADNGETLRVIE